VRARDSIKSLPDFIRENYKEAFDQEKDSLEEDEISHLSNQLQSLKEVIAEYEAQEKIWKSQNTVSYALLQALSNEQKTDETTAFF